MYSTHCIHVHVCTVYMYCTVHTVYMHCIHVHVCTVLYCIHVHVQYTLYTCTCMYCIHVLYKYFSAILVIMVIFVNTGQPYHLTRLIHKPYHLTRLIHIYMYLMKNAYCTSYIRLYYTSVSRNKPCTVDTCSTGDPLYCGHHWEPCNCPDCRGVLNSGVGTKANVHIRDVSLFQGCPQ